MRSETLFLAIDPARISLLRFLLEGHEGLAVLTTLDSRTGLVRLLFPRTRYAELITFLDAVATDLRKTANKD